MVLLHDNALSHAAKLVKETIEAFGWEILSHAAYSPDLAPSDYYEGYPENKFRFFFTNKVFIEKI